MLLSLPELPQTSNVLYLVLSQIRTFSSGHFHFKQFKIYQFIRSNGFFSCQLVCNLYTVYTSSAHFKKPNLALKLLQQNNFSKQYFDNYKLSFKYKYLAYLRCIFNLKYRYRYGKYCYLPVMLPAGKKVWQYQEKNTGTCTVTNNSCSDDGCLGISLRND